MSVGEFLFKYKRALFGILVFTFFIYGFKLFFYSISIDTEVIINDYYSQIASWNSIGRFGLGIIKNIFNLYPFNYYIANILMILFLSISVFFLFYLLNYYCSKRVVSNRNILLFGMLVVSSPILAEQFNFTLQCLEIAGAFFILDIGVICFFKSLQNRWWLVFSVICLGFCIGCYQSFMTLMIAILFFGFVMKNEEEVAFLENKKYVLNTIMLIVLGFLFYQVVSSKINLLLDIESTSYLTDQIQWLSRGVFFNLFKLGGYFGKVLIGYGPFYSFSSIMGVFVVFYRVFKRCDDIFSKVLNLGILVTPFLLAILLGNSEVIRAQVTLPIVIAFILIFLPFFSSKRWKRIYYILVCLVVVLQISTTLALFISDYNRYQLDVDFANEIMEKVSLDSSEKIVFVGYHTYSNREVFLRGETMGASFFEWDKDSYLGINKRAIGFMNTLGYSLDFPTVEEYQLAKEVVLEEDSYFYSHEIIKYNNLFIIKLS